MKRSSGILLALVLVASAPPTHLVAQSACGEGPYRDFDFWIGEWTVRTATGALAGHNTIRSILGGCVLHEHYTTPRGYEGESLNMYDRSRGVWHQTWTDNGGLLLRIEGGLEEGRMVMQGETLDSGGSPTLNRITWSTVDGDPDRVRQLWELSSDGGSTWSVSFDGLYVRDRP